MKFTNYFYLVSICLIFTACQSENPVPQPIDIEPHLTQATQLMANCQLSAALDILDLATDLAPDDPVPLLRVGQIYLNQGRLALAERQFEQVLSLESTQPEAMLGLAEIYMARQQPKMALVLWEVVLERASETEHKAEAWLGLGQNYLMHQSYRQARHAFQQALHLKEDFRAAWYLAALTLPIDLERGLHYLRVAEDKALAMEADGLWSGDEQDKVNHLMATVISLLSEEAPSEIASIIGIAFVQLSDWALAHYALSIAVDLDISQAQTWAFLGYAQGQLGLSFADAFQQARDIEPDLVLVPYFEGILLRHQGHYEQAIEQFLVALDLEPNNPAVALEAALTLAEKGDYASAEAWYQAIVALDPDSITYQTFLAEFYIERSYRVAEQGLPAVARLLELAPDVSQTQTLLGWAKFQTGAYKEAEDALREAIALDEDNITAYYYLGRFLDHLNRDVEAKAVFSYVVDHDTSAVYRQRILGN